MRWFHSENFGSRLLFVGLLLVLPVAYIYASEFVRVDSCLDSGGSFDYGLGRCDYERNHLYVPFGDRNAMLIWCGRVGAVLMTVGLLAKRYRKRRTSRAV